jgi:hypothetical protein
MEKSDGAGLYTHVIALGCFHAVSRFVGAAFVSGVFNTA